MLEQDLPQVLKIEKSVYAFPWSVDIFLENMSVGHRCLTLKRNHLIAGYGILAIEAGEAHLMNLCVRPSLQQRGLGKQLLDRMIIEAQTEQAEVIFLEVRRSNRRAIDVYMSAGFCKIGARRDYYRAKFGHEDALILGKQLDTRYQFVNVADGK